MRFAVEPQGKNHNRTHGTAKFSTAAVADGDLRLRFNRMPIPGRVYLRGQMFFGSRTTQLNNNFITILIK